jgi:hypothetical protein
MARAAVDGAIGVRATMTQYPLSCHQARRSPRYASSVVLSHSCNLTLANMRTM